MDLHALVSMTLQKNDKTFVLIAPWGSTYPEAQEVVLEMAKKLEQLGAEALKKQQEADAAKDAQSKPVEEVQVEVVA